MLRHTTRRTTAALRRWLSARPTSLLYETCDVFTKQKFGGNPLAVCFEADGLSTESMQKIAAEFNYSETTFVLPPIDPANTAAVRIFTPVCVLVIPPAICRRASTLTIMKAYRGSHVRISS